MTLPTATAAKSRDEDHGNFSASRLITIQKVPFVV